MNTGYMLMMANLHEGLSDAEIIREEMRLAELAEEVGYDAIWCAEHHFESYSMAVDNLQILTWLAARTSRVKLGSAALVMSPVVSSARSPVRSGALREALNKSILDFSEHGKQKCDFSFPSFSTVYDRRK